MFGGVRILDKENVMEDDVDDEIMLVTVIINNDDVI